MSAADPGPLRVCPPGHSLPLHGRAASRRIEQAALQGHPPFTLMARAGAEAARLALALVPHAQRVWIAVGPGNNGGDGLVLARHLHRLGRQVWLSGPADPRTLPEDARRAHAEALADGLVLRADPPDGPVDLAVDALLGLGQSRPPEGALAAQVAALNAQAAPVLALDLPTGLCADTGRRLGEGCVRASATLSLLTLKPGLFTAEGRDAAGEVWWSRLGEPPHAAAPDAWLGGPEAALAGAADRAHASHKGRYGDLWVLGGAPGMSGAGRLAARAALAAGAGRVFLALLDAQAWGPDVAWPELMQRPPAALLHAEVLQDATVVCGCGGGDAVATTLPAVLRHAARLVLDADALNAVANDGALRQALQARGRRGAATVLTPHPLEAARLLQQDVAAVQARRLAAAQQLAENFGAVVVLKGSGSIVARPGTPPCINPSGNGRLATAGTGDVLAGWLGGHWASLAGRGEGLEAASQAARAAVWLHGRAADLARGPVLPASALIGAMQATQASLA